MFVLIVTLFKRSFLSLATIMHLMVVGLTCMFSSPLAAAEIPYNRIQTLAQIPTIDGTIYPGEWPEQNKITLSRAFHDKKGIRLYFSYDNNFLYLGAYVEDSNLWADGDGGGGGNIWDHYNDDSIEWYFDINNSRDTFLMPADRMLALNIGNFSDLTTGGGIVSRRSFNKGDGAGGAGGAADPVTLAGINYKVHHFGTVNNPADSDQGYSVEVAVPWGVLSRTAPADGEFMGINVIVISDDTGGTRDWSDNRTIEPPASRFTTPIRLDEYVELRHSPDHGSQSGLNGPAYYQIMQFQRNSDSVAPDSVTNLNDINPRPHSVELNWLNPGDNGSMGVAAGFEVRYSTSPLDLSNFASAKIFPYETYPKAAGARTTAKVTGLQPDTVYYFSVRAYDLSHNYSPPVFTGGVLTTQISEFGNLILPADYKGAVRVSPRGRYFITENGQQFIPIGHHYLQQNVDLRHLYTDPVSTPNGLHNFSTEAGAEQKVIAYLDKLKANGINTMRLFLEDHSLYVNGAFNSTNGAYWLEYPRGTYNSKMADFLVDLLRLSSERGIYVLISPFDTFYYDDYLNKTPWYTGNGGPISNINDFFNTPGVLQMAKDRWSWVIQTVKDSGYADVVFGYEVMNEWDSFEWTRPHSDVNEDAKIRVAFIKELAEHIRSLDGDHLLLTSNAVIDPRGALGALIYYSELFDANLPHLYLPGNREPWNNPETFMEPAVVREQSRAVSWWTLNQLNRKPILNGEWGPSDGWMPDPSNPAYFADFEEADDDLITRKLWFTELASGAAGPGIRMQGGVRGFNKGLHLSTNMLGTAKTLAAFTETGKEAPVFDFTDFASENLTGQIGVEGTAAKVLVTGCSDGRKGLVYLLKDRNATSATVTGATLAIDGLPLQDRTVVVAEFWSTAANQTAPLHYVSSQFINNRLQINIPAFHDDWAVRFYATYTPPPPMDFNGAIPGVYILLMD